MNKQKTTIDARDGEQQLWVIREFDISVDALFKAYTTPEILEQWMGTKVIKLENKRHGAYQFETTDPLGNVHRFNGVMHEFSPNLRIVRTFEMENTAFDVQMEFLQFEKLNEDRSKLTMHIVFKSVFV